MPIAPQALLAGSRLPQRWSGRRCFVVLDLEFGTGEHFLALWQAWQQDSRRCDNLVVVALAAAPPDRETLARVHRGRPTAPIADALIDAWPPPLASWQALNLAGGRLRLLLRCGPCDPVAALRDLAMSADAIVTGPGPAADRRRWLAQALARAAAPGASLLADRGDAGWQQALTAAGFVLDAAAGEAGVAGLSIGRFAPRFTPRFESIAVPSTQPEARPREALVIGAGLAGAAAAAALAGWGWQALVLDRHAEPAGGASGNPAGLYHGLVHGGDGPHAKLFRAAALYAQRCYAPLIASGTVPGGREGLLRLHRGDVAQMHRLIVAQRLPPEFVQALDQAAASALAGLPLPGPAWWFAGGGWLSPAALVRAWLATPGVSFRGGTGVAAIRPGGPGWLALDEDGRVLAQAAVLVLAGAEGTQRLLSPLGSAAMPLQRSRGQVSGWLSGGPHPLRLPVAGDGYALPLSADALLCGATTATDDEQLEPRAADERHNFERLARLTGLVPSAAGPAAIQRVGWRLQAADRLPVVGPVPAAAGPATERLQAVSRLPGLYLLTALGSRGITLAPLMGELIAAQIAGVPWPLERSMADAVDPARWTLRVARRAARPAAGSRS